MKTFTQRLSIQVLVLALLCGTSFADHSICEQEPQAVMAAVRTNVRLVDPFSKDSCEENRLDLKGTESSSVFTLENAADVLKFIGTRTWRSGAKFTTEALEHHLGDSAAAKIAAVFIQTPWEGMSYEEWAVKVGASTAHKLGFISGDMAKNLNLTTLLWAVTSEDGIGAVAQCGLKMVAPQFAILFGEEFGWAVGKIGVQAPGYVAWIFDGHEINSAETVAATKAIEDLIPEEDPAASSTITSTIEEDEELAKAGKSSVQAPVEKSTLWGKTKKVWNKFTHSVKVGASRMAQAVRENLTWENTKTYVSNKVRKLTGFGGAATATVKASA